MGIVGMNIGIGPEPFKAGKWKGWFPDLPVASAEALQELWERRAADRQKHPRGIEGPETIVGLLAGYVRIAKRMKLRPNSDDPANVDRLAALMLFVADDIWFNFFLELFSSIPATAAEVGPDAVDGPDGPRTPAGWHAIDQWEHTAQRAAWRLLGIPADTWERIHDADTPPPAKKLRDLLDAPASPPPPARKRPSLRDRDRREV